MSLQVLKITPTFLETCVNLKTNLSLINDAFIANVGNSFQV